MKTILRLFFVLTLTSVMMSVAAEDKKLEAPLIGIMTVNDERFHTMDKYWAFGFWSYVPRSYINYV